MDTSITAEVPVIILTGDYYFRKREQTCVFNKSSTGSYIYTLCPEIKVPPIVLAITFLFLIQT